MDIPALLAPQVRKYECLRCGETQPTHSQYIQHCLAHIGITIFLCQVCQHLFHTHTQLETHTAAEHEGQKRKKYSCEECGKEFNNKTQFGRHSDIHAGKKFMCEQCGKLFSQKGYLKVHQAIHSSVKSFKCDVCGRKFTQKSTLVHHAAVHTGKRFNCDECGKIFSRKSYLSYHQKTHRVEEGVGEVRKFGCSQCTREFSHKGDLTQHVRSVHQGIKFGCEICRKEFTKKSNLAKHIKTHQEDAEGAEELAEVQVEQEVQGKGSIKENVTGTGKMLRIFDGKKKVLRGQAPLGKNKGRKRKIKGKP